MLQIIWDTRGYFFWLLVVSLTCLLLEFFWPWRRDQKQVRSQLGQDVFWLIFNGHYAGVTLAYVTAYMLNDLFPFLREPENAHLISGTSLWVQFLVFFIAKDFIEWCIHNALHRFPYLWNFHKVHHTIRELDWIGNFRFHWMEIVVYKSLSYLPLVVLGVDGQVILWIAILSTLVGHLNHSNLNITWGPLRYVFNSSRMHVWHHMYDLPEQRKSGVNFGIVFSVWDWLFRTAYWPSTEASPTQQPSRLGFPGMDSYPQSLIGRLLFPLSAKRRPTHKT